MSLIIIGKIGIAGAGIAVASVGGIALHWWLNPATVEIYGFISADASDIDSIMECQIDKEKFSCNIEEVTKLKPDTKNHVLWSTITGSETKSLSGELNKQKFYKITINASELTDNAKEWETQPIKVFFKNKESLGSIISAFVIEKNKVMQNSNKPVLGTVSTKSFVGKSSGGIQTTNEHKCSWDSELSTNNLKDCKIYPFVADDAANTGQDGGSDISALTFKKTEDTAKETKANKYYLIEFTSYDDSKELKDFADKELIYAKDPSNKGDEKVTFSKISPVKVVGEQLLILKDIYN